MNLLVQNEVIKLVLKRKMRLIGVLLLVFIGLMSYGQKYAYDKNVARIESLSEGASYDWKSLTSQRLSDLERRLESPNIPEDVKSTLAVEIQQLTYFVDNDVNPITPSAAKFTVGFIEQGIMLFIPLLIGILAADLVSGEFSAKTIKVLLTRAVPRWKILLSKYISLIMMTTIVMFIIGGLSTLISYAFFHEWGFSEPIATGFSLVEGALNTDSVILVTRFYYTLLVYSLGWFVSLIIATITFLISVLVRSSASAISLLMAFLIGGQFLQFFLSDWLAVKYFFVTNLDLTRYLTGSYQPIEGMSLGFSIMILTIWAIGSLGLSFLIFSKKDILV